MNYKLIIVASISAVLAPNLDASAEDYSSIRKVFAHFDVNGDGQIDLQEHVSNLAGDREENALRDFAERDFASLDTNADAGIDIGEFIADMMATAAEGFEGLDRNGDDALDIPEVIPREADRFGNDNNMAAMAWTGSISGSAFKRGATAADAQRWDIHSWFYGTIENVPAEYLVRVGEMFAQLDADGDGQITRAEYMADFMD